MVFFFFFFSKLDVGPAEGRLGFFVKEISLRDVAYTSEV